MGHIYPNCPDRTKGKIENIKRQQNSKQQQQQKKNTKLKTKLMQWQDNITSRLVSGNATNKKKVINHGSYWIVNLQQIYFENLNN